MNPEQLSWGDEFIVKSKPCTKSYYLQVQEETQQYGLEHVGIKELLALIIGAKANLALCQELALMPVNRLMAMGVNELRRLGASSATATRLEAIFQLTKRLQATEQSGQPVSSPSDVAQALAFIANEEQEHMVVLMLNTKNIIKKKLIVTKGTVNSSLIHPREVFKSAIRENASAIIIGHNHPSGDPTPSREDIEVTKRMKAAGETVGIELMDHVIIGTNGYRSLKEMGII